MKFARYLDENTVPEWRKVYIQYRGLKKLIKRVAAHREARIRYEAELGIARTQSSSTAVGPGSFGGGAAADPALRRRTPASASPGAVDPQPAAALPSLPPVTLQGTGLRLSSDGFSYEAVADAAAAQPSKLPPRSDPSHDVEAQLAPPSSAREAAAQADIVSESDSDDPTTAAPKRPPPRPQARVTYGPDQTQSASHPTRRANSSGASSKQRLLSRVGSSSHLSNRSFKLEPPKSLQELIDTHFDDEEAKIFSACNAELERIVTFYEAQEHEAARKYAQLVRQLTELAEHRREYRAKYNISDRDRTAAGSHRHRMSQLLSNLPGSKMVVADEVVNRIKSIPAFAAPARRSAEAPGNRTSLDLQQHLDGPAAAAAAAQDNSDDDAGGRRRAQALAKMQASLRGWDDETDKAMREANKAAAMSHDPEAYAAARKKLKAAVIEYYKFLDILTNYKILNRTGFAKIMKKLSKGVGVACAEVYYADKVAPTRLVTSDRIERLRKATEDIYAAYFEHGNRKQALNRLRAREDHTTHHYSVFRSGFYLGIALCAVVGGVIESQQESTHRAIPQWQAMLRVYGAEFIPTLFALLFGLNLAWWHEARINTTFIFEFDVRTTMDRRQFFELPALLMLLLACCFWVSFVNPFPEAIAPTTWPTVWLVIALVLVLNPLPVMLPASRWWFVKSVARVFTAGCKRVEFRDFFLGDELNSIAWTLSNLWYVGCEWHHDWAHPDRCSPNSTYWTAVLLAVPAFLRLGQCIRRWVDSEYRTHLHLVNAGKYASAVVYNFVYIHYRRNGSRSGGDKAVWIVFAVVYSVWHIAWDLVMDWSVLKPRARYFLLRNEISFPQPVYYVFMVVDVVGRSAWIAYLIPGRASVTLRSFLVALAEMLRRVCWNNLRVENEQIGNTDSFKIVRDLPLPYRQKLRDEAEAGSDTDGVHSTGIFANVRLARLRKKAHAVATHTPPSETDRASPGEVEAEVGAKRKSLIEGLRTKLVPDARSDEIGKSLDERAVTKGRSGRDYTPRRGEYDRGLVDVDSDDDDEDDDDDDDAHEAHASSKEHTSDDSRGTSLPQPPPRAVARQRRHAPT
ncbi:related to putative phosphate transporter 1 [Moesziomyces antarcticus]|nr:related to putative phosphate transporter 1 [Moesziomyces antarcticus]